VHEALQRNGSLRDVRRRGPPGARSGPALRAELINAFSQMSKHDLHRFLLTARYQPLPLFRVAQSKVSTDQRRERATYSWVGNGSQRSIEPNDYNGSSATPISPSNADTLKCGSRS